MSGQTLSYQGFFGPLITFFNRCINTNAIIFFILLILYVLFIILRILLGGLVLVFVDCIFGCCQKADEDKAKKVLAPVHFCWRVPRNQVIEETEIQNSTKSQKFEIDKKLFQIRYKEYRRALAASMKQGAARPSYHQFVTLHSYDYRLNPELVYLFRDV